MNSASPAPQHDEQAVQQVMVRMPPELHQAIKDRARSEERTMAQTIRHAMRQYLSQPAA